MRVIFFMLRKEFKQIFRTREMLAIIFGMPLIQMVILGFAITTDVKNISLIIADRDNSYHSREIARMFTQTERFHLISGETDQKIIEEKLQNWTAQMALIIPENLGRDLRRGNQPEIQILTDGLDGNTAGVAIGYAQGYLMQFARIYMTNPANLKISPKVHQVSLQQRAWYNPDLNSSQYMVPGIVVVLLTVISSMLSSINLVREKEIGTLEQLMVSPLKRWQLLFGKIFPFWILSFVELLIVMTFAQIIFSIHISGSIFLLAGLAAVYLFTTLGLGIFVSTITGTQQQAMFISWFFMVFMLLMSGFFIPIENMPDLLRKITYLNPMRYFMYIIRDIIQKGASLSHLLVDVIPMAVYGLIIFTFAVLNFHKRIS